MEECPQEIVVSGLRVVDPGPSYGMTAVELLYRVVDFTEGLIPKPMAKVGGGPKDGGWDATYDGFITFQIDEEWNPTEDFVIELFARAKDKGDNIKTEKLADYTMAKDCLDR